MPPAVPPAAAAAPAAALKAAAAGEPGASAALLAAMAALDLPQPTPMQPAEVAVLRVHYAPAARLLAVVLADGRCALCRTADSGIHPAEQLQLFRWVHKPAGPGAPCVVAAAINPASQMLALGLSHGRVAIYTIQSLLSAAQRAGHPSHPSLHALHQRTGSTGDSTAQNSPGSGGAGQPEPTRILSLADWGYRSSVVGAAAQLQWSPDGRVLAVGYSLRGMAVWTPSGCRLMCTLRQAAATTAPGGLAAAGTSPSMQLPTPAPVDSSKQEAWRRSSTDSLGPPTGSPRRAAAAAGGGLWPQHSNLNPSKAPEAGVLEVGGAALGRPFCMIARQWVAAACTAAHPGLVVTLHPPCLPVSPLRRRVA